MQTNPVFRSLNRPLTILGAERKLFFFALVLGACVFKIRACASAEAPPCLS